MDNATLTQTVEKNILKYIISDKFYITLAESKLKSEFFSDDFQNLYKFLIFYYRANADTVRKDTLELLFQSGQYRGLTSNLVSIFNSLYDDIDIDDLTEADFISNVEILKTQFAKKTIVELAQHIAECNDKSASALEIKNLLNDISTTVIHLSNSDSNIRKSSSIAESADEQLDSYLELYNNPNKIEYIPTGFDEIDDIEGGFRRTELIYVIGRKGTGKSILLLNLAYNACKTGKNILLFSLEISKEDYERRLAACACSLSSNKLKRGKLDDLEYDKYKLYLKKLKEHKTIDDEDMGEFVIVDVPSQCTPAFIESQLLLEQRKRRIKFDVIVVDYAGIMQPDQEIAEKRHQQGAIALSLKQIARKYDCAVYSASQMSRQGRNDISQKGGHADSAHIAESDQVADHIDWGLAIKISDESESGELESFKTRDAAPFKFPFIKNYAMMQIKPIHDYSMPKDPENKQWPINSTLLSNNTQNVSIQNKSIQNESMKNVSEKLKENQMSIISKEDF